MRQSVALLVSGTGIPEGIDRVVVIGAGMAGLAAARALASRGIRVVVVDARDRTGGRCHTRDGIDHGAHWIHGTEGNPLTNLARQLAVPTLFVGGDSSYSGGWEQLDVRIAGGRSLAPDEKLRDILAVDEIRDELDALRRRLVDEGAPDLSMRDAVHHVAERRTLSADARRALDWHVALAARDDCAADEGDLSFLWWDDGYEVFGYGDSVIVHGFSALIDGLADGLDIRLNHTVRSIDYGGPPGTPVVVENDRGTVEGDAVVCTLPLGVLKAGDVEFLPSLPRAKRAAIERLGMGDLTKVVVRFERAFWPRDQYVFGYRCRDVCNSPSVVVNLWKTHQLPALVLMTGGELARSIERWDDEEATAWGMEVLRDLFGGEIPDPTSVERTRWHSDPFARGSYSFVSLGATPADIDTLAEPLAGRLFFAGEATYRHHWGAAHGAYASGLREAARLTRDPTVLPTRVFTENRRWRDTMMRATRLMNVLSTTVSAADLRERMAILGDSEVFGAVPSRELTILATMFESMAFRDGELLFRAGERATSVYAVVEGVLDVLGPDDALVERLGRGNVLGEYGMFGEGTRTTSVRGATAGRVLVLDYDRFHRYLLAFPESAYALLRLTVERLGAAGRRPGDGARGTPG